jgi:hypothetical protein
MSSHYMAHAPYAAQYNGAAAPQPAVTAAPSQQHPAVGVSSTMGVIAFLFFLAFLVLYVLYAVGMGYSTKCFFGKEGFNCSQYTSTQKSLMRLAMVLFWIGLAFGVIGMIAGGFAINGTQPTRK